MTGFRLGYVIAPTSTRGDPAAKVPEPLFASAGMPIQWGALGALLDPIRDAVSGRCGTLSRRRAIALEILRPGGDGELTPEGAFYIIERDTSAPSMTRSRVSGAHDVERALGV